MAPCSLWAIIQKPWDPELILKMCHLDPFNVKLFTVAAKLKALACNPFEVGAQAGPHVEGVKNNLFKPCNHFMLCYVMLCFISIHFWWTYPLMPRINSLQEASPNQPFSLCGQVCPYIKYIQKYEYCRKIQYDICKNKINTGKIMLQC